MSSNQPNVPWWYGQQTTPPTGSTGYSQAYPGQSAMDSLTAFWNWATQHQGQSFQQTQARGFPPQSPFGNMAGNAGQLGASFGSNVGATNAGGLGSQFTNSQMDNENRPTFMGAAGNMVQGIANNTRFPPQGGVVPQNVGAGGATPPSATAGVAANQLSTRGNTGQGVITATGATPSQQPVAGGNPNGLSQDELKWKGLADQAGLNWDVVKNVYMNPARQGSPNPAYALGRALKDKSWGDAALAAGILRQGGSPENDAWNNQVWIDHFNAGDNQQYDPMAGHNDAWANYQANYQNYSNLIEPPAQPPDWYQAPPP